MCPCEVQPIVAGDDPERLEGNYFVSTYPPFSTWKREGVQRYIEALDAGPTDALLGYYVHVPFCVRRCPYCYYLSYAGKSGDDIAAYVDALLDEASLYSGRRALAGRAPAFFYFGGGTPSLLPDGRLGSLLAGLHDRLDFSRAREVTFECAPQSVTRNKLGVLRDRGVTRLSMGVQQLDDDVLTKSGRVHLVADVERAWDDITHTGFDVVNLDLMVGMVGESDGSFFASLDRVIEMQPESVTFYQLEIPLNTPLYRELTAGLTDEVPASWTVKRRRLTAAFARLEEAGYTIRSGYAAIRDPERHAFVYQDAQYRGADLIGLGVASFSYLSGVHEQNVADLGSYIEKVRNGGLPLGRAHALSDDERLVREFVLQLKLGSVDLAALELRHGVDPAERFAVPLAELRNAGWLVIDDRTVILSRDGLVRADQLLSHFYRPEHRAVRYS